MNSKDSLPLDYLIVGQGLAGSVLAHHLIQKRKTFRIIDKPSLSISSRVAGGLFNPVVFKRLVKSWMADEQLEAAEKFYTNLETLFGTRFFHKKELLKIFAEPPEKILWEKKRLEEVGRYLSPIIEGPPDESIQAPQGYARVSGAGYVDVSLFLDLSSTLFKKQDLLVEEAFNHPDLKLEASTVVYKNMRASRIIFCEGHLASQNPWFSWMPFNLAKGEVLTVKIPGYSRTDVVNKGVFILPIGNDLFRVGSTFAWDKLDEVPTEAAKEDLILRLQKVLKLPFEIVDHKAGIRPTVINRRPLIGVHPDHPALCMFNGMGSKGVMIAPYFADHFIAHLEDHSPLSHEVDIRRFWK
ncbi:MAG: NAD(P)/FAD-dependent oxidoreductase [Bacteroidia bacterium]